MSTSDPIEPTQIVVAEPPASMAQAENDPTRIVPATAAASPGAGLNPLSVGGELSGLASAADEPGRIWFDERLRAFVAALTHDHAGQPRTPLECRALAAAARDMAVRIGQAKGAEPMQDGISLAPEQLLANTYHVRALIARGGVGEVYRARHRDLRTDHAIKILRPRHALDTTLVTLMLNEARLLQQIEHDGVVSCQALLRDTDGRLMLVMDHVRGPTLSARLTEGALPEPELMALFRRLAETIAAVHAAKVLHNDLSPDNVILRDGSAAAATLLDFGVARSFANPDEAHVLVDFAGKYSWVSPEQLAGHDAPIDVRSDLYGLGLVMAAAARGRRLDMGRDVASARLARSTVPGLDGIAPALLPILTRLLQPAPADRFQNASALVAALSGEARPGGVRGLFARLRRR